jgi:3-(3-hydroxy-phenyl)propionate hydroxylase
MINGQLTDPVIVECVASPYPQVLYSGQHVIEKKLTQPLTGMGGEVERLRCRYLVAAAGAKSTVRSSLASTSRNSASKGT